MRLLERDDVLHRLHGLLDEAGGGSGRVVLIRGEAGIGKTAVVRSFAAGLGNTAYTLWGGCDDLLAARPLGPIRDMAFEEPALDDALGSQDRHRVFGALYELLNRSLRPTVAVIEDVHWADEATLDLIKYLGRRIDRTHGLLVLTYRDGAAPGDRPLRLALGDVPSAAMQRIALAPLSQDAVSSLASGVDVDPGGVWQVTGGNPFFVTELLAPTEGKVPGSVREAVRARIARLSSEAEALVALCSVVPSRIELSLIEAVRGPSAEAIAECEEAGVLEVHGDTVSFRHELARQAVEADLASIRRRELNGLVMRALEDQGVEPSRMAHHARAAADPEAIIRLVPSAARRAAELESHVEAVSHLRALEPYLEGLAPGELADLYDLWAYEEYLGDSPQRAAEIIAKGIVHRRQLGNPEALGRTLLIASRIAWVRGRRASAIDFANEAASVLEPVGGEELGVAYSTLSQLAMLGQERERTMHFGERALRVTGDGPTAVRAHALNNIGSVMAQARYPDGREHIEESFRIATELGLSHDQARAAVNIAWCALYGRDLDTAQRWIVTAIDLAGAREMPSFEGYAVAQSAILDEWRGRWSQAEAGAVSVLDGSGRQETNRMVALTVLGRIQARRGESVARSTLFEAWEVAKGADETQRLGPVASALAEYLWLGGRLHPGLVDDLQAVLSTCLEHEARWMAGELAQWLYLAGVIERIPAGTADPYRMVGDGEWETAARFWKQIGVPYDQAVALTLGGEEAQIEALAIFDGLGAVPPAARLRAELQASGATGVPRGPARATRENPLGLTSRQAEVLDLLAEGLTNAEIADRLYVSSRTVDHHVSAILSKLGASSRADAVLKARHASEDGSSR